MHGNATDNNHNHCRGGESSRVTSRTALGGQIIEMYEDGKMSA
jgi:hypothetical protein